ncbi:MAG: hypothetical protein Q9187_001031 [Circinaria calcarea]
MLVNNRSMAGDRLSGMHQRVHESRRPEQTYLQRSATNFESSPPTYCEDNGPPSPPLKDNPPLDNTLPSDLESFFSPLRSSRTNSIYTLSRASFSSQLSQLTSLHLPQASSLSSSIVAVPTAAGAVNALTHAAAQIQQWIQKAAEVLRGLNAEDDVEWAAAGGREGLGEVDAAIGKFESLVKVYVTAIEELQQRHDVLEVPVGNLRDVVDQMEFTLVEWENVRRLLKGVKEQVELAMEWEELWGTVLGDIGLEMENLGRLVFEMEEKRHRALSTDPIVEGTAGLDIQELETIVEESPMGAASTTRVNHRFSLPPAFPASSPIQSPKIPSPQEDSNLLALFARMQPLRASLDFLPMRLSTFQSRAESILPTACAELESRRQSLEKSWKKLEADAEGLRRELGEDRWVLVFRNAGRQAQKMCESVERSISKLQEAIDIGMQHSNPPALAKKVESYEAKKTHYGPAIQRVLAIIEKGVNDRLTVNGEILRLHADTQAMWSALEAEITDLDLALNDMHMRRNQQFRDSISTIVSNDRSFAGSALNTPGSSPASSVVMGPSNGKGDPSTPYLNGPSRRDSIISTSSSHHSTVGRNFTMPANSAASRRLPNNTPTPRSVTTSSGSTIRDCSPYRSTPTPSGRAPRPSMLTSDSKPRWNSSPKIDYSTIGHNFKPLSLTTPSPHAKNIYSNRTLRNASYTSNVPLPSPLAREFSASPAPSATSQSRSRKPSSNQKPLTSSQRRHTSPSPARSTQDSIDLPRTRLRPQTPASRLPSTQYRRQSIIPNGLKLDPLPDLPEPVREESHSPSVRPKLPRPATAMAAGRRISMLPQPTGRAVSGRESVAGNRVVSDGREGGATSKAARRRSFMYGGEEEKDKRWR